MYRLVEGGTTRADHADRVSNYGEDVPNHDDVAAIDHIAASNLHQRRGGEAGSGALCAGYPVHRG